MTLGWLNHASAEQVYKCTNLHGDVAFQDHVCAPDQKQDLLQVASDPPIKANNADDTADTEATPQPTAVPTATVPQRRSLPSLWFCTRYDGAHYLSTSGIPQRQAVPLGVLGYPPQSLSQAYGGGRSGISAPGSRPIPVLPSGGANGLAADYIWTEDSCAPASIAQTCKYLREQYEDNHRILRNAAKGDLPPLEIREHELRDQLGSC